MQLRNLITFIHVAELGSFTKAADQLGYTQSTVSFQIKQLEEELDCLLFERINHTITLTECGQDLVYYAQQIRALTDEFKEVIKARTSVESMKYDDIKKYIRQIVIEPDGKITSVFINNSRITVKGEAEYGNC